MTIFISIIFIIHLSEIIDAPHLWEPYIWSDAWKSRSRSSGQWEVVLYILHKFYLPWHLTDIHSESANDSPIRHWFSFETGNISYENVNTKLFIDLYQKLKKKNSKNIPEASTAIDNTMKNAPNIFQIEFYFIKIIWMKMKVTVLLNLSKFNACVFPNECIFNDSMLRFIYKIDWPNLLWLFNKIKILLKNRRKNLTWFNKHQH